MAQLNFGNTIEYYPTANQTGVSNGTFSFFPINILDSISLLTFNIGYQAGSVVDKTLSIRVGLYSITGNTLSIANSFSGFISASGNAVGYISMTNISIAQNITPGTWWFGVGCYTAGSANWTIQPNNILDAGNSFPGSFIGGRMTVSTATPPSSVATSNLDITGFDAMSVPLIVLSA